MSASNITPQLGFALVAGEQVQDALASAAKILARFKDSPECLKSAAFYVELHNQVDKHRLELLREANGGVVLAATLPKEKIS